jgi:hypothetical protein
MVPELLEQIAVKPLSGRLLARQIPEGKEALVGVVHLPGEFVPNEGALYLAIYAGGRIYVTPSMIDPGPEEHIRSGGLENLLRANIWRKTNAVGTLTVRFMEAFPETNGWTIYGASNQPIFQPSLYERGHAFLEVSAGTLQTLPAPENLHGSTMSQILDSRALWPDAQGTLYALPSHEPKWRAAFHEYSVLRARVGAGELTKAELDKLVAADPDISAVKEFSNRPDMEFYHYLAALHAAGELKPMRRMTAEELTSREETSMNGLVSSLSM